MHALAEIIKSTEQSGDTWLLVRLPGVRIKEDIDRKTISNTEMRFDDGRHISNLQRRKAYATIRDIATFTGYLPEECKEWLKYDYMIATGAPYFSLSDCDMSTARDFITHLLEIVLKQGIPLSEAAIERADDIGKYLYACIKYKKCAVCGRPGEIHHVDTIGMGNDRRTVDDSDYRKICLCREHHTIAHQRGMPSFERMYHVYGIVYEEDKNES